MAFGSYVKNNAELIQSLKKYHFIKDNRVEKAMLAIDRKYFCDSNPYVDAPQDIGYDATISAPHMHAYALEILKDHLYEGAKALDIGSGSGYLTACMAIMVGKQGLVVGIDCIDELVTKATENVRKSKPELFARNRLKLVVGDGTKGYETKAPYDAIHVGAAAKKLLVGLVSQLKPGGRIIIPIGKENQNQMLQQIDKDLDGEITKKSLFGVVFVQLVGGTSDDSDGDDEL